MNTFPNFDDGDVIIYLSQESPANIKTLHTSKLAQASSYFKASLAKPEWLHNSHNDSEKGGQKILVLDFEDEDVFPLLLSKDKKPSTNAGSSKQQIQKYNDSVKPKKDDNLDLTPAGYHSSFVIAAYEAGFALLYDQVIRLPSDTLALSRLVAALVTFADAYDMLDRLRLQILGLISSGPADGNDIIAENPFAMLYVAYKLRSGPMYREAIRHVVPILDLLRADKSQRVPYDMAYYTNLGAENLAVDVSRHLEKYTAKIKATYMYLTNSIVLYDSDMFSKKTMTYSVATAVFRNWVHKNFMDNEQTGILNLNVRAWNISDLMVNFGGSDWRHTGSDDKLIPYGLTHQAVEACFENALRYVRERILTTDNAKGMQSTRALGGLPMIRGRYLANVRFEALEGSVVYPWDDSKEQTSAFDMRQLGKVLD